MKRMNRAHSITNCGTRKLEDWWICGSDDLDTKTLQWRSEVTLVSYRKMGHHRSVAAQTTTDADGITICRHDRLAHAAVTRTG